MIINLRGTHGSGKSAIVRRVMSAYDMRTAQYVPGRRRPIGYLCEREAGHSLWIVGSYETVCGGCDTISSVDAAYEYIRTAAAQGHHVLFEGILVGHDVRRCAELRQVFGYETLVLLLETSLEECLAAARRRRVIRGDTRFLEADNFQKRAWAKGLPQRMEAAGVVVKYADREGAAAACAAALGLPPLPSYDEKQVSECLSTTPRFGSTLF